MARRHRRVGGKHAFAAHFLHVVAREGASCPRLLRLFIEQFDRQQARVAFVHVEAVDVAVAQRPQHPHAADAENDFLTQTIVRSPP